MSHFRSRSIVMSALVTLTLLIPVRPGAAQDRGVTATPQLFGVSELGWSSAGHLPFSALDMTVLKAGDRYVMYYIGRDDSGRDSSAGQTAGRAFSHNLIDWTQDTPGVCQRAGDLCLPGPQPTIGHFEVLPLPDGRFRVYRLNQDPGGPLTIVSDISTDGLFWRDEPGTRLVQDPENIWERGDFTFVDQTLARLPDGRVRMYYQGGALGGSPGTPSEYSGCAGRGACMVILSAISSDGGTTFVREPGVRINPRELGPLAPDGNFGARGMDVVAIDEGPGKQGFRMFTSSFFDGVVTYFSADGLTFTLEGQVPILGADVESAVLPDGRLWVVTNSSAGRKYAQGCPAGCPFDPNEGPTDLGTMNIYGPQPASITIGPWNDALKSATIQVAGAEPTEQSFEIIEFSNWCDRRREGWSTSGGWCSWEPQYYNFSVSGGTVQVRYNGPASRPDNTNDQQMVIRMRVGDSNVTGAVYCMGQYQWTQFCAHRR